MRLFLTLAAFGLTGFASAADVKIALTGENTKIEWTGTKKDGKHSGGFKTLTGTATVASGAPAFAVEIDADSLYSDDDKLTGHLKAPDFFAVKENPKIKFASTKVVKGDKAWTVTGDLTLLGKAKEISFPAEISIASGVSLKSEFKFNRHDYGMTYGKGKIDDDVTVKLTLDAK